MNNSFLNIFQFNFNNLKFIFSSIQARDIYDILLTSFLIYVLFWFLNRTKSLRAIFVAIGIFVLYVITYFLNFSLTYKILETLVSSFFVILIIIFQDEIKRVFYFISSKKKEKKEYSDTFLDDLTNVVFKMAEQKIGALIVIPGHEIISPYITGGISLNADFSIPLILSIFDDSSPGHDGAIILEGHKISQFGVHLPLSADDSQLIGFGTRHRAGLGISEKADCLSIIVSEEKGTVSVALNGKLEIIKDKDKFKEIIKNFIKTFDMSKPIQSKEIFKFFFKSHLWFYIVSLFFSVFIWFVSNYPNLGIIQKNFIVPIEFINIDSNINVSDLKPIEVVATFSGRSQDFNLLDSSSLKIIIDLNNFKTVNKYYTVKLKDADIKHPKSLNLVDLNPEFVSFKIESKK